jgi:putative NADH-flavin reductase
MNKIIVFGGSGGTGKSVIKQAVEQGYEVTALLRSPESFDFRHQLLKIVKGDVLQLSSFENEIVGTDAVISCLGSGTNLKSTNIYSQGTENILQAMRKANVQRLLCISAGAVETNKEMGFFIRSLTTLVLQRILKNVYADMLLMERVLEMSDIDWTILRPARLTDHSLTKKYRTAVHTHLKTPWSISRADVAHYLLRIINDQKSFCSKIEIAN